MSNHSKLELRAFHCKLYSASGEKRGAVAQQSKPLTETLKAFAAMNAKKDIVYDNSHTF